MTRHFSSDRKEIDGILLVDKPQGWTSHDVCAFVRKRFRIEKVGHAGTLDPQATGLLVLLLGRATKNSMQLSASDKEYRGIMELGVQTDSHDRQGEILRQADWSGVTLEDVRHKALEFTGEIIQVPPMVSALKHKGVPLYKLARKGKTVPREGRNVTVYRFEIEKKEDRFVHFSAKVSKGTYLRTLVNDLGEALGCLATLAELRRTVCGSFTLEKSVTVETLKQEEWEAVKPRVIPMSSLFYHVYPQ